MTAPPKVVILAGGLGTRLSEETTMKPKPMVEVGPEPILWHIMKIYSSQGHSDFVVCAGYKQEVIKKYFIDYEMNHGNVRIDLGRSQVKIMDKSAVDWRVEIVDTGLSTMTGGRIKRIERFVAGDDFFLLTYGDGLADIDLGHLVEHHHRKKAAVTVTAVQPAGRFGSLTLSDEDMVVDFTEKPKGDKNWINGGFSVMTPEVFDYIEGDTTVWEQGPMSRLASAGRVAAYKHRGFWRAMDTMTDKRQLDQIWASGTPPWKIWTD